MLRLYYMSTCPYCRKVLSFFEENNIKFEKKDVSDPVNYKELLNIGKMAQVPFLVDTDSNKYMYESDVIIDYVRNLNQ